MMIPYGLGTYFNGLYETLLEIFPDSNKNQIRDLLRELILSPEKDTVEINKNRLEKTRIVELLRQKINEENNPEPFETRYHNFLDDALSVIKHMNDGFISENDYNERNTFLARVNKKEFLLFTLLALLKTFPQCSNEKLENTIAYKVGRLREINDLIENYTLDTCNVQTDVQSYERAKVIYRMLKSLQGLGSGYVLSKKEKINLGISHDDDEDLEEDYAYSDWIKRLMLIQLRRETRHSAEANANNLSDMFNSGAKLGLSRNIFELGESYKKENTTDYENIGNKIMELRGALQKRTFDKNRFIMLEESNKTKI